MNKRDVKPGLWVRTQWDDCGAIDGIVVSVSSDYVTMFSVGNSSTQSVDFDQIIAIGNFIDAKNTGLNK